MNCDDYQRNFSKLMDNELGEEECASLFTHMGACSTCREFFRTSMLIQSEFDELRVPEPGGLLGFKYSRRDETEKVNRVLSFVRALRDTRIPLSLATAAIVVAMVGTIAVNTFWLRSSGQPVLPTERVVYSYLLSPVVVEPEPVQTISTTK